MTLPECQEQIAQKYGYRRFSDIVWYAAHCFTEAGKKLYKSYADEAAELFATQHNASLSDSLSYAINQLKMVRHLALMKGDEKILTLCNAALDSPLITKYDKEK